MMKPKSLAILAAFVAVTMVVAAPSKQRTINLVQPMIVGSVTLQPGLYTIEWKEPGPDVQVSFSRGEEIIVTVPAKLEAAKHPNDTLYTYQAEESAAPSLVEIETKSATLHFASHDIRKGK